MKKYLLQLSFIALAFLISFTTVAQTQLAPDQNPNFSVSRDKYMKMSDSVTTWHSTTQQETYKAVDWLADRKEARADRREFRRQLRSERARWSYDYYDNYNYSPSYRYGNNRYGNNYYNGYYRRNNSFTISPWGLGYWWR